MSSSRNNNINYLAVIVHLKNKIVRIRNIVILMSILLLILLFLLLGGDYAKSDITNNSKIPHIANIKIEGVIVEDEYRSEVLEKIADNDKIKAVISYIDSPGGTIVGSEILYNNLRKIAKKKPLVVIMNSVAASGGYMASIAADHIIAHNGTLTGSIGVIMQSPEATALAEKIGIKFHHYKSSTLKASPSLFEKPNPQVDKAINETIMDSYQFFCDLVRERRGVKIANNNEVFDGRVFTGRQALKAGLVDEIGNIDNALNYLQSKNIDARNLPKVTVKLYEEETKIIDKIIKMLPIDEGTKMLINQGNKSKSGILAIHN